MVGSDTTKKRGMPKLRCCSSCEWVFNMKDNDPTCPECGFGSYGARYVYGQEAYRIAKTQSRWLGRKLTEYEMKLRKHVADRSRKRAGSDEFCAKERSDDYVSLSLGSYV